MPMPHYLYRNRKVSYLSFNKELEILNTWKKTVEWRGWVLGSSARQHIDIHFPSRLSWQHIFPSRFRLLTRGCTPSPGCCCTGEAASTNWCTRKCSSLCCSTPYVAASTDSLLLSTRKGGKLTPFIRTMSKLCLFKKVNAVYAYLNRHSLDVIPYI